MDFKPTKWKVIISLILGFLSVYFFSWTACFGASICVIDPFSYLLGIFKDVFSGDIIGFLMIIYTLIVFGIVYIIWSLFQKK